MRETRMELHWGRLMRCYVERPPTLDAMFQAAVAADADAEAVVDGSTRLTYRELDRRVDRLAAGLVVARHRQGRSRGGDARQSARGRVSPCLPSRVSAPRWC